VTEFRANAAQFIEQVQETGEPVIHRTSIPDASHRRSHR
jgi:hypothetical protein